MDYNKIELLLNKYLEGDTTLLEERELDAFFRNSKKIPENLLYAKNLFKYFEDEQARTSNKQQYRRPNRKLFYSLSGIAASFIVGLIITFNSFQPTEKIIYAYINGQPITDILVAKKYAQKYILSTTKNLDNGTKSLYLVGELTNPSLLIKKIKQ